MNKAAKITISVIACLLLVSVAVLLVLSQRVTMNPAGTVGNTAGNLNNDGYFCEYDGTVYFYNSFPGGGLFAMNPDESNIRRINGLEVRNILAGGKYLYYFHTGNSAAITDFGDALGIKSFQRSRLNGSNAESLTNDIVVTGQLVDNYLYLLTSTKTGPSFYKVKINNTDQVMLADYLINPACAYNGIIYYNGTRGDHYLYSLDTATDVSREIWKGNIWYPIVDGDYIYYMDVANDYRICRYSRTQDVIEVLTQDRADCFNVGGGYIYYQKNGADAKLMCMRTDGTEAKAVAEGNYTRINMTSQYVYFQQFGDDFTLYQSPLGSSSYEAFHGAREAAQ